MTEKTQKQGNCLCNNIQISVNEMDTKVGACHCGSCRKWGGPLLAIDCGTDVSFTNEQNISVYDSSDWAQRGFCKKCGSHLFYQLKQSKQYIMPVGLFEGDEFVLDHQIFIDEKPSFYCFANKTKNMTGAEVFAEFAEES